jgi:hypothetical protein
MRDESNGTTEPLCAAVDNADRRLKRAFMKLDEMMVPAGAEQEEEENGCPEDASDESEDFFRSFDAAVEEPDGTGEEAADDPVI